MCFELRLRAQVRSSCLRFRDAVAARVQGDLSITCLGDPQALTRRLVVTRGTLTKTKKKRLEADKTSSTSLRAALCKPTTHRHTGPVLS